MFTDEKRTFLRRYLGAPKVAEIESSLKELSERLRASGVDWKAADAAAAGNKEEPAGISSYVAMMQPQPEPAAALVGDKDLRDPIAPYVRLVGAAARRRGVA